MSELQTQRGGGFFKGALAGLLASALGLAAWSLSAPGPTPEAAPQVAPQSGPQAVAPEAATPQPPAPQPPAPQSAASIPAKPSSPAPAPVAASAAAPERILPEAPRQGLTEPAPERRETASAPADGAPADGAATNSAPTDLAPTTSAPTTSAPEGGASENRVAAPPAPVEPAWRRNAAAFDARGKAAVAVVLSGLDGARVSRALSLSAPLTLAVDPAAPDAAALVTQARAAGAEVVSLGAAADPGAVGLAAETFDAEALTRAAEAGLLALSLTPGRALSASGAPVAAAAFRLDGAASAERAFQTLQEASRRAQDADAAGQVVALEASDAALTGLARWLAVTDAAPAPLSAVAR